MIKLFITSNSLSSLDTGDWVTKLVKLSYGHTNLRGLTSGNPVTWDVAPTSVTTPTILF